MSFIFPNRARMTVTGTPGFGDVVLGSPLTAFQTFSAAGAQGADRFPYLIEDGVDWEYGVGTYLSSGPSVNRTFLGASSTGSYLSLSSSAVISCAPRGEDLLYGVRKPPFIAKLTALTNLGSATLTDQVRGVEFPCLHVQPDVGNVTGEIYCAMEAMPVVGDCTIVVKVRMMYYGVPGNGWEGAGVTIRDATSGYQFAAWLSGDGTPNLNHTLGTGGLGSFAAGTVDGSQPLSTRDVFLHLDYVASGNNINLGVSINGIDVVPIYNLSGVITNPGYCGICWLGTYANSGGGVRGGEYDFIHYAAGRGNGL